MRRILLAAAIGAGTSIAVHREALLDWALTHLVRLRLRDFAFDTPECPQRHVWGVDGDGQDFALGSQLFQGAHPFLINAVGSSSGKSQVMTQLLLGVAAHNALYPDDQIELVEINFKEGPVLEPWEENVRRRINFGDLDPDKID